jgi:hypothetical protein
MQSAFQLLLFPSNKKATGKKKLYCPRGQKRVEVEEKGGMQLVAI